MWKIGGVVLLMFSVAGNAVETVTFEGNWGRNPLFNMAMETASGMEIVLSMHSMTIEEQEIDGVVMKSYGVPGVFLPDQGAQNLTGASRYVAIPQGAQARVQIIDVRTEVVRGVEVPPAPDRRSPSSCRTSRDSDRSTVSR